MSFKKDYNIEERFSTKIKNILAQYFIQKDVQADLERGQDFAIYIVHPFKVAVRLRRFSYFPKFHNEFTVRWTRPLGTPTEIHKIREGLVQYFLYGFINEAETRIIQYFLANLAKFGDATPQKIYPNNPPDSELAIFNITQFPRDFIIKFWCNPNYVKYRKKSEVNLEWFT